MSTRAAIYARISEDEPNYDKPAVQVKNLRKLAAEHDYEVVEVLEDRVSAFATVQGELKERPGFTKLMEGIAAGRYDVVLAVHQDRLSRDTGVAAMFKSLCRRKGVTIHTKTMGLLNLNDPMERAMSGVVDIFSELDVAIRMAKQADRFEDEILNGRPLWGIRPFGFRADPNAPVSRNGKRSQRWTLHHEEEAAELRWAYKTIHEGGSIYSIVKSWNERGILTTSAGMERKKHHSDERVVVSGKWT